MSRVYTDTIEPRKPTQDITLGTTGETITLPGNDLRVNTVKDKGGNTLWTSDGSGNLSSVNAGLKGNLVLMSTQNPSNAASVSFTSGIDSTYDVYIFKFMEINPATDQAQFSFQMGASYNTVITSSSYRAYNDAGTGGGSILTYLTSGDQAQGTAFQQMAYSMGNDADENIAGELYLFNPTSTTYKKHFYSRTSAMGYEPAAIDFYAAGYFNTTTALTQIQFKMNLGNFDGIIKMYGLL